MHHFKEVELIFNRAVEVLGCRGFIFRAMEGRTGAIKNTKRSYTLGYTNLKNKTVTIDIYTAKKREPKKMSAILRIIAHELAHHKKPPFRQRYRGKWINRIHYPAFYRQVKWNIDKLKKDAVLQQYF